MIALLKVFNRPRSLKSGKSIFAPAAALLLSSCAVLHHVQIGEIDNRKIFSLKPVDVKVSETGIDLNDARALARIAGGHSKAAGDASGVMAIVQLFQMGPKTGAPVYDLSYIRDIRQTLQASCPDGFLTGIEGIRETRKYPVISGEIVKVKAYCATKKASL